MSGPSGASSYWGLDPDLVSMEGQIRRPQSNPVNLRISTNSKSFHAMQCDYRDILRYISMYLEQAGSWGRNPMRLLFSRYKTSFVLWSGILRSDVLFSAGSASWLTTTWIISNWKHCWFKWGVLYMFIYLIHQILHLYIYLYLSF